MLYYDEVFRINLSNQKIKDLPFISKYSLFLGKTDDTMSYNEILLLFKLSNKSINILLSLKHSHSNINNHNKTSKEKNDNRKHEIWQLNLNYL